MNKFLAKISIIILITIVFVGCNSVKKVSSNQHLLTNNTVIIDGSSSLLDDDILNQQIELIPNSSIFGFNLRLHMYNLAKDNTDSTFRARVLDNPKRYRNLSKWLSEKQVHRLGKSFWYSGRHEFLKKTGEKPVIIDSFRIKKSAQNLKAYFNNQGYLRAKSTFEINYLPNKKAKVAYKITKGTPYILDSIKSKIENKTIDSLYSIALKKTLLRKGDQFNAEKFKNEQARLHSFFINHGVYNFQLQSISFDIDTAYHKTPVVVKIQDPKSKQGDSTIIKPYKIHKIERVNIFIKDSENKTQNNYIDSTVYKNFHIYSTNKLRFKPKAITDAVFIHQDSLFSDYNKTLTSRLLSNLRIFNYPIIQFKEVNQKQALKADVFLKAKEKYSFRASADFTHSNIQDFGVTGYSSLFISNIFRRAEILEIGIKGNLGSSKDFANPKKLFFNIQEYGADMRLTFPRIIFPFRTDKIIPKTMTPTTLVSLGFSKQLNIGLDKESFTSLVNFNWIPNKRSTFKFDLANLQYIKNINVGNYFNVYGSTYDQLNNLAKKYNQDANLIDANGNLTIDEGGADQFMQQVINGNVKNLETNSDDYKAIRSIRERKSRLTENNLILASSINYSNSTQKDIFDKAFYSFKTKIESAGNVMSLLANLTDRPRDNEGKRNIFGLEYSQYIKAETEYIKNWDLKNNLSIACRAFIGAAFPYGNSKNIPFTRSYFAGGANDNRAWQSYSLGAGTSNNTNDFNEANFKIALNTEIRFNLFGQSSAALFADCGNIWNLKDSETDEKKIFKNFDSLKGLALGTGIGYRYNFNFFILRLDWGFKTYNPALEENNRWLTDFKINKSVFNIGINYPF